MQTVQESLSTISLDQFMIRRGKNQVVVASRPPPMDGRPSFVAGRPPLLACRPPLQNLAMTWVESPCMHEHSSLPADE
ncbi:hypothetical protein CsSME_00002414 [Camellia sinensis var. sinensis]